jgi:homoserine kinase type II
VPDPAADRHGEILHSLHDKPAAVVNRLQGKSELTPQASHCAQVGTMLARLHLAGRSYDRHQGNLRGLAWWESTVPVVLPHLTPDQASLIRGELAYQQHIAASSAYQALPVGPIHADLFRDNVMFVTPEDAPAQLTGFFDFYFAGVDTWLFDLGVCLNVWCIDLASGAFDADRLIAMLEGYEEVRPLSGAERALFNPMLRAAALRFWISRLWDFHLPREASLLQAHDPGHFERVLLERLHNPVTL